VPARRLRDRPTGDLLVLLVAGTICAGVLLGGAALIVSAFVQPEVDVSGGARAVAGVINTLVGLLAGFLAGKTGAQAGRNGDDK
jgi:hypothetical protein